VRERRRADNATTAEMGVRLTAILETIAVTPWNGLGYGKNAIEVIFVDIG
jgi:hypothetical protein